MEPIVDSTTAEFAHHFTVSSSSNSVDNATFLCSEDSEEGFIDLVYAWAPGEAGFALPNNVGLPYGPGEAQSFMLEIHYNNPNLISGAIDNSGVRFYYTEEPREHAMGILQLGDPFVALYDTPVGEGISEHTFECQGGCSALALDEPVTVLREYINMHATGTRMTNQQRRMGEIVHNGIADMFDFNQQGSQPVQQSPFQIRPGDAFTTRCTYNGKSDTVFGLSSQQEMCIAFLFYFPRQTLFGQFPWICAYGLGENLPQCDTQQTVRQLDGAGRAFGIAPPEGTCREISDEAQPSTAHALAWLHIPWIGVLNTLLASV